MHGMGNSALVREFYFNSPLFQQTGQKLSVNFISKVSLAKTKLKT